ncbi:MAG: hypothetical protein DRO15_02795 [Thermoprotei archaeon]|nr:MAG: hypothetical protein DRO15_02795 [Thermoprotei archaeon]
MSNKNSKEIKNLNKLMNLADLHFAKGDVAKAYELFKKAYELLKQLHSNKQYGLYFPQAMIIILGLITSSFNLNKYKDVLKYIEEYEEILKERYESQGEKESFVSYLKSHSSTYYVQSVKARTLEILGRVEDSLRSIDNFLSQNSIHSSSNTITKIYENILRRERALIIAQLAIPNIMLSKFRGSTAFHLDEKERERIIAKYLELGYDEDTARQDLDTID